ncbi:MAG: hypothetical protein L3K15_03070 [Thermoplasmata archaeon]|nr:hypothetical protein [Thermoplasmata archaeon]
MRPRLVLVGFVLLALTVGAFVSLYLPAGPGPSTTIHTFTSLPAFVPPKSGGQSPPIDVATSSTASLYLSWKSSVVLNVTFGNVAPCGVRLFGCPPPAPPSQSVGWSLATSGQWNFSGAVVGPYYLYWGNAGTSGGSISFTLRETVTQGRPYASLTVLLVDASLVVLSAIGGVAVFLGLFLRGGVYRGGPPPVVSRSAEDAADVAAEGGGAPTGPRTGRFDGGSAGPPRTPAAPPGRDPPA